MKLTDQQLFIAGGALLALGALWWFLQPGNAAKLGIDIGSGAVNAVVGAGVGAIQAVGQAAGVPPTNMSQCKIDLTAGNKWAASFSCPASDYIAYLADGTIPNE